MFGSEVTDMDKPKGKHLEVLDQPLSFQESTEVWSVKY
jgi:hypothetical protein